MMRFDCAVVGGGPAGLSAAVELRRRGRTVTVIDRDEAMGGIPRHSGHLGFGLRDLHRVLSGPAYARRLTDMAAGAGVDLRNESTVTSVEVDGVWVTSPRGRELINAQSVILATGCRERPRSALLVPGDRPAGVLTTGSLQRLVHLKHARIGSRAVVVGAEHVSCSAVLTLAHAGCSVAALVAEAPRHATWPGALGVLSARHGFDVHLGHRIVRINGRQRVESVDVIPVDGGASVRIACDTVVFTGGWVPDHELVRRTGLGLSHGWRGPSVDQSGATSKPGVFATGNLLHGALTADVCALEGRRVGVAVDRWLERPVPGTVDVAVNPGASLAWVHPTRLSHATAFLVEAAETAQGRRRVAAHQDGRVLVRSVRRSITPGLPMMVNGRWVGFLDREGGPVRVDLE